MADTNAKEELLRLVVRANSPITCAILLFGEYFDNDADRELATHKLCLEYTTEDYEQFMSSIDKEYDAGYGGQELFGNVWFEDGTWAVRSEYDGSEWWTHIKKPDIPVDLEKERKNKIQDFLQEKGAN